MHLVMQIILNDMHVCRKVSEGRLLLVQNLFINIMCERLLSTYY